ncbi:MAG: hypothetical protein QNJ74_09075 [Trichodesmium sp. MO_231.B1]|nr:hypothetical protein [Trichodesmium sp. MO_231.B1]
MKIFLLYIGSEKFARDFSRKYLLNQEVSRYFLFVERSLFLSRRFSVFQG